MTSPIAARTGLFLRLFELARGQKKAADLELSGVFS
jgi:hypothetical protein